MASSQNSVEPNLGEKMLWSYNCKNCFLLSRSIGNPKFHNICKNQLPKSIRRNEGRYENFSYFDLEKGLLLPFFLPQIKLVCWNLVYKRSRDHGRLFFEVSTFQTHCTPVRSFFWCFNFVPPTTLLQIELEIWKLVCILSKSPRYVFWKTWFFNLISPAHSSKILIFWSISLIFWTCFSHNSTQNWTLSRCSGCTFSGSRPFTPIEPFLPTSRVRKKASRSNAFFQFSWL